MGKSSFCSRAIRFVSGSPNNKIPIRFNDYEKLLNLLELDFEWFKVHSENLTLKALCYCRN
jgi:hypothetical protein